jgi:hypothetical protein
LALMGSDGLSMRYNKEEGGAFWRNSILILYTSRDTDP